MKIKLHNSLSKKFDSHFIIFDDKMFLHFSCNDLWLYYRINDCSCFLRFSPATKEFKEGTGFGRNDKEDTPNFWKVWNWKEMSR